MDRPADWKEVKFDQKFVFWIPPGLQAVEVRSPDSQVQRWESQDLIVSFDYGRFADPLTLYSGKKSYEKVMEPIDGYDTTIVSFEREDGWRFTAVHFPDLGKDSFGQTVKLTLLVEAGPQVPEEVPSLILRSIRFSRDP